MEQAGRAGASMPPRGWWGCSPREEDSGAGSTPEKLAVSRTFFEGVRERGVRWCGLGLSTGDRSGKAAASARARFWWGDLASAPAAGLWAESGDLPVPLASFSPSRKDGGPSARWLRVEQFVRASSSCVRLLLFGCCVLADLPVGLRLSLRRPLPLALYRPQPRRKSRSCTESLELLLPLPLYAAWRHAIA